MPDNDYGFNKWLQGRARFQALANREGIFPRGFERPEGVVDPYDFTNRNNTQLTPEDEVRYQDWLQTLPEYQRNTRDYDLRGYWKDLMSADTTSPDARGHMGDRHKKPSHFTFSNQSRYNGKDGFVGGAWFTTNDGNGPSIFFNPSNSTNFASKQGLQDYILRAESPDFQPRIAYDPRTNSFVNQGSRGTILLDNRAGDYYNDNIGESTIHPEAPKASIFQPVVNALNSLSKRIDDRPVQVPLADTGTRG